LNISGISQTSVPEILEKGSVKEQLNYIETNTRIYENFRAIREDMFQMVKNHALDSLSKAKSDIAGYVKQRADLNSRIDSLENNLNTTMEEAKELSRTQNSIKVIGMNLNKTSYNSIMWLILSGLATLLILGFIFFKRNLFITLSTKKDLDDLKNEFEQYRQKTRIEREKVSMDHFNEIRKLKGK
jgi:preprotein translocase subunit SecF